MNIFVHIWEKENVPSYLSDQFWEMELLGQKEEARVCWSQSAQAHEEQIEYISSQLHDGWHHIGSLKPAVVRGFLGWKPVNTAN